MSSEELALLGGSPVRASPLPLYNTIGEEEIHSAIDVMKTGILSGYVASPGPDFFGGRWTRGLEEAFCNKFGSAHAISMNSATSGLHAAISAAGVGRGDQVIVSPYTMAASATSVVMSGGTPVFVDIEPATFCLDPELVERAITPSTKAIMAVNIFGQAADLHPLKKIAAEYGLTLVEDNSQAPGAHYHGELTGTVGDMGVFSLNRHKTMQCGEGGVVICNDNRLAQRLRMVRNHGEAVLPEWPEDLRFEEDEDLIGYNYRLTEVQSAIALPQLQRLDSLNHARIKLAEYLTKKIKNFDFLSPPEIREGSTHVYYLYPLIFHPNRIGISRDKFIEAMRAEGMPISNYVRPLYRLPLYRRRCGDLSCYLPQNFPVTENLWKNSMIVTPICRPPLDFSHIDEFVEAISKIKRSANKLA